MRSLVRALGSWLDVKLTPQTSKDVSSVHFMEFPHHMLLHVYYNTIFHAACLSGHCALSILAVYTHTCILHNPLLLTVNVDIFALYICLRYSHFLNIRENMYNFSFRGNFVKNANINPRDIVNFANS